MDDKRRVALAETLTMENGAAVATPSPVLRYQLDNHLGSASLELDASASVISYEEYYPYGDTCYRAGRSTAEVSQKRYRYTGKEKDEESGLYYHGARYYACWLGRWTASDPIGVGDGVNLYMYVRGNPVNGADSEGTSTDDVVRDVPESVQSVDDFRNWVFDEAGAYIDGDVTMERAEAGHPIFNYNNSDITVDQERRSEIEAERNRSFGSYLPRTAAGEEALEFYTNQIVEGERQGGFTGFMMQAGGYAGGIFSALWTPETATQTALTLGSAGIGSLAPAGSIVQKGLTFWGAFESSVSITEGMTGTTSGVHAMDLGTWAWSGQYQGGQEMSGAERGLSIGLGSLGLVSSFASAANIDPRLQGTAQSTGTQGHAFVTRMTAFKYQLDPRVQRITMDLGYKRLLGDGSFKYGPRPDVGVLYKSGSVKAIEVASKTDVFSKLYERNSMFMLNNGITGSTSISQWALRINRFFPK